MLLRRSLLVALALGCAATLFAADDWPQFRGPSGNAVGSGERLATEWNNEKNIAWKAKVPGFAWSQPIVWGDKIFVTTAITENQQKPRAGGGGFGGFGGPGGQGGGGRRGGFGPPGGGPPDQPRPDEAGKADAAKKQPAEKAGADEKAKDNGPRRDGGRGQGGFGQGGPGRGGFGGGGGGRGGFGGGQPPNAIYQWKVICIDANSGNVLWEKLAHEGKPRIGIQPTNTYASETPITDGERVYAYFGMTGLFCFDMAGNLLWNKDVGAYPVGFGPASSPAFDGERVFLQIDNDEKSFLVAFDKKTGDEVWRVDREERGNHSTPYVWKNKLRTELVTSGNMVRSYDPATGKLLWEYGTLGGSTKSTPVGDEELLVLGNSGGMGGGMRGRGGFGGGGGGPGGGAPRGGRGDGGPAPGGAPEGERGPREGGAAPGQNPRGGGAGGRLTNSPLVAIKAGATGNVSLTGTETSNAGVAWAVAPGGPEMASPLMYEGNVYVLQRGNGIVGCYDAKTGKEHYRERLEGARSFYASPVAADGKIYCLDEDGQTFVLAAGPELKLLATNKLDEMFRSSPAITGEKLLLRGVDHLYCIAQSGQ